MTDTGTGMENATTDKMSTLEKADLMCILQMPGLRLKLASISTLHM